MEVLCLVIGLLMAYSLKNDMETENWKGIKVL